MGDHDRAVAARELLQSVQVLRHDHHMHGLLLRHATVLHESHGVLKALGHRCPHVRHANAREAFCLGVGLRSLDLQKLVSFAFLVRSLPLAARRVDLVHCVQHGALRLNVRDEHVDYVVPILPHGLLYGLQNLGDHLLLGLVALIKGHGGERGPEHVVNLGLDLLLRACDVKDRHLHQVLQNAILHGSNHRHGNIVLGLAVGLALDLVHRQRDGLHRRAGEAHAVAPRLLQTLELSELLHHTNRASLYAGKAAARHDGHVQSPQKALETTATA
mmetsp:Transcript_17379/g.40921  ORF Transcript_17379/g.40921 Transcript_17379/m.40921 type:complete len:273 (-) Transcript_17379:3-821(-)